MSMHLISNLKRISTRLSAVLLAVLLLIPACTPEPQPVRVEEITFQSGEFTLVGEVAGRIALPDESSAAVNLFFQNTATEAVTVVTLEPGQRSRPGETQLVPLALSGGGVTVCEFGRKAQNLEDVFMNIVKESNHDH